MHRTHIRWSWIKQVESKINKEINVKLGKIERIFILKLTIPRMTKIPKQIQASKTNISESWILTKKHKRDNTGKIRF